MLLYRLIMLFSALCIFSMLLGCRSVNNPRCMNKGSYSLLETLSDSEVYDMAQHATTDQSGVATKVEGERYDDFLKKINDHLDDAQVLHDTFLELLASALSNVSQNKLLEERLIHMQNLSQEAQRTYRLIDAKMSYILASMKKKKMIN